MKIKVTPENIREVDYSIRHFLMTCRKILRWHNFDCGKSTTFKPIGAMHEFLPGFYTELEHSSVNGEPFIRICTRRMAPAIEVVNVGDIVEIFGYNLCTWAPSPIPRYSTVVTRLKKVKPTRREYDLD